jgi:hypothetical protein
MKKIWIFLAIVILLVSCGVQGKPTPTSILPTASPISLMTPMQIKTILPTSTSSATVTQKPTITPIFSHRTATSTQYAGFPTPLPGSDVIQRCLMIDDSAISKTELTGTLVLGNGLPDVKPSLLDLENNKRIDYPFSTENPKLWLDYAAVSPDGKWLAYIELFNNANVYRLHLMSSDFREKPYLDLPKDWGKIVYWLDNQRILISTSQTLPEGVYPTGKMMILNPFLRKWEILSPDLPVQINTDPMPWYYWPDNPIVIYNPSLTRAIYLALGGFYLIDGQSLNIIDHISTQNYLSRPSWSPDGENLAMVIDPFQLPEDKSEIYLFDINGNSRPITNIADAFRNNNEVIESFNWSPDGLQIAFTYFVMDYQDEHIAVVNVSTGQTVDFCLPSIGLLPPIWSPDGNKIAFASGRSTDQDRTWKTTIVDMENEYAVQVADTMLPLGWMESP